MQKLSRFLSPIAVALPLLAVLPAVAQERPVLQPTRDAVIDYRVEGRSTQNVRMYVTAGGNKTRIEPADGKSLILIDRLAGKTTIVLYEQHKYLERPLNANQPGGFEVGHSGGNLTKKGTETIAGRRCTVWETKGQRPSTGCITDDGLVLKGESQNPGGGERTSLIATSVQVGPLGSNTFMVPAGFTRIEVPNMQGMQGMPGMPGGIMPGMPSTQSLPSTPSMPSGIQIPGGFTIPRP